MKKLLLLLAAVVCISTTASAQDKGDWAIMPRINIYTAWDADTVFGIGAAARYNVLDQLRLELPVPRSRPLESLSAGGYQRQ